MSSKLTKKSLLSPHAQAAHQCGQFRRSQRQLLCLVDQQLLGRGAASNTAVIAETISQWLHDLK